MKKVALALGLFLVNVPKAHAETVVLSKALVSYCSDLAERAVSALERCDGEACEKKDDSLSMSLLEASVDDGATELTFTAKRKDRVVFEVLMRAEDDGDDCVVKKLERVQTH